MNAAPRIYWITGLPAAGKTTLARALAERLSQDGQQTFVLDGDELRRGLCADLGLSDQDRTENIRRAGEVARLLVNAGVTTICAFVSPFAADRQRVRSLFAPGEFCEIHLNTTLEECIRRDPKGLYAKAKLGQIKDLTGWDAPYEPPFAPDFCFDTQTSSLSAILDRIVKKP